MGMMSKSFPDVSQSVSVVMVCSSSYALIEITQCLASICSINSEHEVDTKFVKAKEKKKEKHRKKVGKE